MTPAARAGLRVSGLGVAAPKMGRIWSGAKPESRSFEAARKAALLAGKRAVRTGYVELDMGRG